MATVLVLGFFLGFLGVLVFGLIGVAGYLGSKRQDMDYRRRWNRLTLMSLGLGLVCIAPFLLGIRVG